MKILGACVVITCGLLLSACGFSSVNAGGEKGGRSAEEPVQTSGAAGEANSSPADDTAPEKNGFPDLHEFQAKTIDGSSFGPEDFAAADVTAINIWSTTCAPCVREMPELAEYAGTLPENLRIMTWCLDADISASGSEIAKYLSECGFTGITIASGDGDLQKLYNQLMYTPTTIFVDSSGTLVADPIIGAGSISERYTEQFRSALQSLGIESKI